MAIRFSCAGRFNRDTEFSEATQVEECAFHAARRAEVAATETLLGALGDLTREAAKHIKPGDDGYAHLHFAEGLLAADDRRRGMNKEKR